MNNPEQTKSQDSQSMYLNLHVQQLEWTNFETLQWKTKVLLKRKHKNLRSLTNFPLPGERLSVLDVDEDGAVPDLTLLSFIDEKQINTNLRLRYSKDKIYVSAW